MIPNLNNPSARRQAERELFREDHGFLRTGFHNRHDIGGGMYRENQPSPKRIGAWAEEGIKTVLNLRGVHPKGYFYLEQEACEQHGLRLINYRMYSRNVHSREKIMGAKDLFEQIEYPAIMHCKSGADRTGIMGVLYRHFKIGVPIREAVEQLSFKYLHIRHGRTGILDFFFDQYLNYSQAENISFGSWVQTVYDPEDVKSRFMSGWAGNILTDRILRRE
ncbi:MAG: tyrosine-protein phosphatase [Hyphomonadaceae bacterium]|nr:tyrosine-protein phosphatase [Hyphomonadaceae bacterium]